MINEDLKNQIENAINDKIINIEEIKSGYSRTVFIINDKYVLKIVTSPDKEINTINEVNFLTNNNFKFTPKVIYSNFSKDIFSYICYLEEKINGDSLLLKWPSFNNEEKKYILNKILKNMEQLHSFNYNCIKEDDCYLTVLKNFDDYLNKAIEANILSKDKIKYLRELKTIIPKLFSEEKVCLIHGDLHFNNILVDSKNDVYMIDYENLKKNFVEKEYDPINRMCRYPNSFNNNPNYFLDKKDFEGIICYLKNNSKEIDASIFDARLLMFDCINSLFWISKYPKHELYNEILFNNRRN